MYTYYTQTLFFSLFPKHEQIDPLHSVPALLLNLMAWKLEAASLPPVIDLRSPQGPAHPG